MSAPIRHSDYKSTVSCRKCGKEYQISGWAEPFEHWVCWNEPDPVAKPDVFCKARNRIKVDAVWPKPVITKELEEVAVSCP